MNKLNLSLDVCSLNCDWNRDMDFYYSAFERLGSKWKRNLFQGFYRFTIVVCSARYDFHYTDQTDDPGPCETNLRLKPQNLRVQSRGQVLANIKCLIQSLPELSSRSSFQTYKAKILLRDYFRECRQARAFRILFEISNLSLRRSRISLLSKSIK